MLVLLLMLLLFHLAYTFKRALQSGRMQTKYPDEHSRQNQDASHWENQAAQAQARGELLAACRALFRASLIRLEDAHQRRFRPGITNREYLLRYRQTSVSEALHWFTNLIDRKWYGDQPCQPEDLLRSNEAYDQIRRFAQGVRHAQRP